MGLTVLRVFCAEDGAGGNPLGVFEDGSEVPSAEERQAKAAELGYSETIFIDPDRVAIFTPEVELPFAGHPMVGAAWLMPDRDELQTAAGPIATWREGEDVWIRARPEWGPEFALDEVDDVEAQEPGAENRVVWCREGDSRIRSRVFVDEAGVPEDEATGSAALRLVAQLGEPVEIRQGKGSRLLARPGPDGFAEVGGLVVRA